MLRHSQGVSTWPQAGLIVSNPIQYCYATFRIDLQCYWDHAIKFARWQHPAMTRWARFAVLSLVLSTTILTHWVP